MGYLTTLSIYNDGIDVLPDNAQKFAEGVLDASRTAGMEHRPVTLGVGMFANLVKVQVPRHADQHTLYVHMGNTVCEMNAYNKETQRIMQENPEFFEKMLSFLEDHVQTLRHRFKKSKKEG